jgi:hypothetical protein
MMEAVVSSAHGWSCVAGLMAWMWRWHALVAVGLLGMAAHWAGIMRTLAVLVAFLDCARIILDEDDTLG